MTMCVHKDESMCMCEIEKEDGRHTFTETERDGCREKSYLITLLGTVNLCN